MYPEVGSNVQILLLLLYFYLSIYFSDNLLLLLPTVEYEYLYFVLPAFSEQTPLL